MKGGDRASACWPAFMASLMPWRPWRSSRLGGMSCGRKRDTLTADAVDANKFYEAITLNTLQGRQYSAAERKEIDALMKQRDRLLARIAKVEADLATIQKDGLVIKKHCSATPDQIQTAIKAHKRKQNDAEALVRGMEYGLRESLKEAKAKLRRLRSI